MGESESLWQRGLQGGTSEKVGRLQTLLIERIVRSNIVAEPVTN